MSEEEDDLLLAQDDEDGGGDYDDDDGLEQAETGGCGEDDDDEEDDSQRDHSVAKEDAYGDKVAYITKHGVCYEVPFVKDKMQINGRVRDYGGEVVVENDDILGQMTNKKYWPTAENMPWSAIVVARGYFDESEASEAGEPSVDKTIGKFAWYARCVTKLDTAESNNKKILKLIPTQVVKSYVNYLSQHASYCRSKLVTHFQPENENKQGLNPVLNGWKKAPGIKGTAVNSKKELAKKEAEAAALYEKEMALMARENAELKAKDKVDFADELSDDDDDPPQPPQPKIAKIETSAPPPKAMSHSRNGSILNHVQRTEKPATSSKPEASNAAGKRPIEKPKSDNPRPKPLDKGKAPTEKKAELPMPQQAAEKKGEVPMPPQATEKKSAASEKKTAAEKKPPTTVIQEAVVEKPEPRVGEKRSKPSSSSSSTETEDFVMPFKKIHRVDVKDKNNAVTFWKGNSFFIVEP